MRKSPSNTAASVVKAMVNAALPDLQPPAHTPLRAAAMQFWGGIVRARARDEWIEVDLVVAAQLAECQACIEDESVDLRGEGTILINERGTMVANPRVSVLEQLARREMALMRTLRMGGRIAGDARDHAGVRRAERTARTTRKEIEADELLA